MALSAAERQRRYAERRRNGEVAETRITFTLPTEAAGRLRTLATARETTMKAVLISLILEAAP